MAYRIKNWDMNFEKAQTRQCNKASWVAIPNKHDGKSFRRITKHDRAAEIFAAWILIVQVASKMPERGLLVDDDGPLDAEDMSDKTGFSAGMFTLAFSVLAEPRIGWIENMDGEIADKPEQK